MRDQQQVGEDLTPAMYHKSAAAAAGDLLSTAALWSIQVEPLRVGGGDMTETTAEVEPSPGGRRGGGAAIVSSEDRCCSCLRYADSITLSGALSAEIGLLDPTTKVETARYPTCLVTPTTNRLLPTVPAATARTPVGHSNSAVLRDSSARPSPSFAAADFLLTTETQPTCLHKRTSSDFPQPSRHSSHNDLYAPDNNAPLPTQMCGPYPVQEWITDQATPPMTIEALLQKHHDDSVNNERMAITSRTPPGVTVFGTTPLHDFCVCPCHTVTAHYILEEFLHQGFTSTVIACRRIATLTQEIIDKSYPKIRLNNHYLSPSSSEDDNPSSGDSSIPTPSSVRKALDWVIPIQGAYELVIKLVHKNRCSAEELERCLLETRFLSMLDHPNVAKLLAHLDGVNELWMFFERACYSDLEESLQGRSITEPQVQSIIRQILLALEHVHSRGVIHCDVKPKNVLVYDADRLRFRQPRRYGASRKFEGNWNLAELKLGDFGLARLVNDPKGGVKFDGVRGSHGYFAPEILLRRDYDAKVDVWSAGIIAYTLLAGYEPFYPPSACISEEIKFDPRYWAAISSTAQDFCRRLLTFDPSRRLSASEALQHPWMHCPERRRFERDRPVKVLPGSKSSANLIMRD